MEDTNQKLYEEVGGLARFVETALRTLSQLDMPIASEQLPQATEHLSDLTRLLENGTHRVMGLTEEIQDNHARAAGSLDELAGALAKQAVQPGLGAAHADRIAAIKHMLSADDKRLLDIMTALSFQDLAGQRIKKVVTILDDIERKLLEMIVIFGLKQEKKGDRDGEQAGEMLKQLEASRSTALKQDLVDDILGQFGFS